MLFNSWEFLFLCVATLGLYYLPFGKIWQVSILLIASALFYAWEEPRLLFLLGTSCLVNAIAVERILFWKAESGKQKVESASPNPIQHPTSTIQNCEARAKRWLCATVALNLGFLAFFKYSGFFADLLPDGLISANLSLWLTEIPLPVGISFYTFQGISLVVDVWRNDISPNTTEKLSAQGKGRITSIRDTSFYISFFPQLVAGPIVKAHEFVDQIGAKRLADIDWLTVRRSIISGYFLKIFVADNFAEQTGVLTLGGESLTNIGPINLISLLYGYSLQIFADFAGYSLIAIGLGALFGYRLPHNFNFPYLSTSITEFWRRWHLSLSSWLRDYLYIPLGGNRKGSGRTYFNLFLVMLLGGLWHGAAWKFALWGSLHGLALAAERLVSRRQKSEVRDQPLRPLTSDLRPLSSVLRVLTSAFRWFITFHLVTTLWLTFMMPDMASIATFFKAIVQGIASGRTGFTGPPIFSLLFYGTTVIVYHFWGWIREHRHHFSQKLARSPIEPVLHGLMIFLILTNPGAPRGFIYFQF